MTVHRIVNILPARALLRRTRPLREREQVVVLIEEECILPRQPRPALGGGTGGLSIRHIVLIPRSSLRVLRHRQYDHTRTPERRTP